MNTYHPIPWDCPKHGDAQLFGGPGKTLYCGICEEIELLREALKPFSDAVENLDDDHPDKAEIWESSAAMGITAGDLRCARNILKYGNGG